MFRLQFIEEGVHVAINGCEIDASLTRELADNLIDQLALLQLLPHISSGTTVRLKVEQNQLVGVS